MDEINALDSMKPSQITKVHDIILVKLLKAVDEIVVLKNVKLVAAIN